MALGKGGAFDARPVAWAGMGQAVGLKGKGGGRRGGGGLAPGAAGGEVAEGVVGTVVDAGEGGEGTGGVGEGVEGEFGGVKGVAVTAEGVGLADEAAAVSEDEAMVGERGGESGRVTLRLAVESHWD